MALLFADGLDSGLSKWLTTNVNWDPTGGVYGGGAMSIPGSATYEASLAQRTFLPANHTVTTNPVTNISFWIKMTGPFSAEKTLIWLFNVYDPWTDSGPINVKADGKFIFFDWDNGGWTSRATPIHHGRIDDGNWHHINIGIRYEQSGYISLVVDGELIYLSTGGLDLVATGIGVPQWIDTIKFNNVVGGTLLLDDIVIWNDIDNGDGFTRFRLDPIKIFTFRPSADTLQANSTPSSGLDRYLMINEPVTNTANYVTLPVRGKDLYEIDDIPAVGNSIFGVQSTLYYNSSLPGYRANLRPILLSNSVTFNGNTSTAITTASREVTLTVFRDFGNSNSSWTESSINSLRIGFENTG